MFSYIEILIWLDRILWKLSNWDPDSLYRFLCFDLLSTNDGSAYLCSSTSGKSTLRLFLMILFVFKCIGRHLIQMTVYLSTRGSRWNCNRFGEVLWIFSLGFCIRFTVAVLICLHSWNFLLWVNKVSFEDLWRDRVFPLSIFQDSEKFIQDILPI